MPDQPPAPPWSEVLAAAIGRRVALYRNRRGLTAQQLSDALRDLGLDLKRTVIGNLESGYRRTVSVPEVLALAYVLGVPPLLLLAPVGEGDEYAVLPGFLTDPWDAARWISGEGAPPGGATEALWRTNVDLLTLYRHHNEREVEWRDQTRITGGRLDEDMFDRAVKRRAEIEEGLRLIRRAIRDRGELPPALPPELAHLDDGEAEPRLAATRTDAPVTNDPAGVEAERDRNRTRSTTEEGNRSE